MITASRFCFHLQQTRENGRLLSGHARHQSATSTIMSAKCVQEVLGTLALKDARTETCGSKAAACAELANLSREAKFRTPSGFCPAIWQYGKDAQGEPAADGDVKSTATRHAFIHDSMTSTAAQYLSLQKTCLVYYLHI